MVSSSWSWLCLDGKFCGFGRDFGPVHITSAGLTMAHVAHLSQGLGAWGPQNFTVIIFIHMKYTKNGDSSHSFFI